MVQQRLLASSLVCHSRNLPISFLEFNLFVGSLQKLLLILLTLWIPFQDMQQTGIFYRILVFNFCYLAYFCYLQFVLRLILIGWLLFSILYNRGVYPEESFVKVKKYGLPMLLTQDEGVKSFIANLNAQLSGTRDLSVQFFLLFLFVLAMLVFWWKI